MMNVTQSRQPIVGDLNRFLGNIQLSGHSTQRLKLDERTLDKDADYFGDWRKRIRGRARREGID